MRLLLCGRRDDNLLLPIQVCLGLSSLQGILCWRQAAWLSSEGGGVAFNRVHLLKGGHVHITESTNFALWLSNFATCHGASGVILFPALLLTLSYKPSLNTQCLFSKLIHHTLRIRTQLRTGSGKAEVKGGGRDAGLGRGFLRQA
jgi:hypothetical protein